MSEQVLPLPLSGGEIIKAVLANVESMLRRDCFLNEVAAYETVQGRIQVSLTLKDCGRECIVETVVPVRQGPPVDESDPDVYLAEAERMMEQAPPNVVRQETDQPLPVLVEDQSGKREVKRVSYAKPQRARALRPEQTVARGAERMQGDAAAVAEPVTDSVDDGPQTVDEVL